MLKAKLILERFDKDHKLLERREQPSRSFVRHFIDLLYAAHAQITAGAPYAMNDITGAARNVDSVGAASTYRLKGTLKIGSTPGASEQYVIGVTEANLSDPHFAVIIGENLGIVIGTGVGAVTPTDDALGTKIAHGRAAGQMEYGGCELINIVFADPNGEFTIRRYFTNMSGGGITVQEVGIYAGGTRNSGGDWAGQSWPFCIARDLTGGVAVADTELLRATYVVQITV